MKFIECVYKTFAVPCDKPRIVYLTSSIMNNIVVLPARSG